MEEEEEDVQYESPNMTYEWIVNVDRTDWF